MFDNNNKELQEKNKNSSKYFMSIKFKTYEVFLILYIHECQFSETQLDIIKVGIIFQFKYFHLNLFLLFFMWSKQSYSRYVWKYLLRLVHGLF